MAESSGGILFMVSAITVAGILMLIMVSLMPEMLTGISSSMLELSEGQTTTTLEKQEMYSKDDYGI